MLGLRFKRAEAADTSASGASAPLSSTAPPINHIELMEERLSRLDDEVGWEKSHTRMVIEYNKRSVMFWLLCCASLSFAILNGYHGFTGTGGWAVGLSAIIIGLLYSTIELTVPGSAHLMSWGSKGEARWAIRVIGTLAFGLGVGFSLVILQGKFASGSDSSAAQRKSQATIAANDHERMDVAQKTVVALRSKVGAQSPESLLADMKSVLSTAISKRETLADTTDECQSAKRTNKERELCAKYDDFRRKREDAIELRRVEAEIEKITGNLANVSRTSVGSKVDVQDKVFSKIFNISVENIQTFKASIIAVIAALLTHMLWAAHGMVANRAIAKARNEHFERNALKRSLTREEQRALNVRQRAEQEARRTADQVAADFMIAKGTLDRVASAVVGAPLKEQPLAIQMQRYFTERSVQGSDFTMQVGMFHDDYAMWAKTNQLQVAPVDRFVQVVKQIGFGVSADGRIVGAALR